MADFVTRDVSDLLKPLTNARQSIIRSDLSLPNNKSVINRVHKAIIETISYLHFPHTNKMKVKNIIQNIAIWSVVIKSGNQEVVMLS